MSLTATAIRQARPKTKPYRLYDAKGLYLEVTPVGGQWWRLAYRFGGKRKLISLGVMPAISLAEARDRRDAARKLLAQGIDPSQKRKSKKQVAVERRSNTFEAVAREWHDKQAHIWVPRHASDVLRRLESNLFPALGNIPIGEITPPVLLAAVRTIEERGARDLAHRVLQVASQVFRYGVATGRCERDPAPDLRGALAPHKAKNQPAVSIDEVPALLSALDSYSEIGDRQTALALRLLALTFARTGELINAEWSEFVLDTEHPVWIVPAGRMKMKTEHIVPLSRQAIEVLTALQELSGSSRYVLPGRNPDKPISNNTLLFALYRLGYKGRMTGHGFRAVASTILNEKRYRPDVVERQLAHCERNHVRGAYNRAEYFEERCAMMQDYADTLDALAKGKRVLPLQRASRPV